MQKVSLDLACSVCGRVELLCLNVPPDVEIGKPKFFCRLCFPCLGATTGHRSKRKGVAVPTKIKQEVIRRVLAGEQQTRVAMSLGVSQPFVSLLMKKENIFENQKL